MALREREILAKKKTTTQVTKGSVAEVMLKQLHSWGVKNIYGVAGDAILPLLDAMHYHKEMQYYAVRHESAAGFMASAEGKATGKIGVALCTSGPGLANVLNGVADASADHIPMLVISGQVESHKIGTEAKQYVDQAKMIDPLSVYSGSILHPEATIDVLHRALIEAISKKGVAHVSIPKDILSMPYQEKIHPPLGMLENVIQEDTHYLDQAVKTLLQAEKPILFIGEGSRSSASKVIRLAEELGAGIIETLGAKGCVPYEHPLFIDGIGEGGTEESRELMLQSDCILIVGATWWPKGFVPEDTKVIQIDISPASIEAHKEVNIGIVGDAQAVLSQMLTKITQKTMIPKKEWVETLKQGKQKLDEKLNQARQNKETPIAPERLIAAIDQNVDEDAIMVIDTGDHTVWFSQVFRAKKQEVLYSGKWRTMGFAIPAANSAKIAYPQKQVVALVGDGCFTMSMMELATAVKYQLPIVVIVFNNQSLAMEKNKMMTSGIQPFGTELHNLDFAKIAEAFGAKGIRVTQEAELEAAIQTALQSQSAVVVDVQVSDVKPPLLGE
ncbi:thiamine pyrophosphate-binding protein [Caldalkalibacillus mannanilyticus]|uniref:thiamine pyrophosphate-binding protein n=1 Tax=Caldalkalibacillus mannanilyticus TaxID=1418 RepID=UPI000468463D|nr:thiamine pyrophosphate-binding protein [Caldalkalibacillus mannanilyticus]